MHERSVAGRPGEGGFALILAILSLMLLTFLGLTMAATTSTELQIATNYRWSQQALYNAEAGLEAARVILATGANPTAQWKNLLPPRRMEADGITPDTWIQGGEPDPPTAGITRDYYREECDTRGGVGYGLVVVAGGTRYEDQSSYSGKTLNGAFTLWVRRDLVVDNAGLYKDSDRDDMLIIVAEGVAPYMGAATAFTAARQATRILETRLNLGVATVGRPCESLSGQEGMGPSGDNYNPCAPLALNASGVAAGLESTFGQAGTGETGSLKPTDR
jgi:Tfp pilus assembly protein PilX